MKIQARQRGAWYTPGVLRSDETQPGYQFLRDLRLLVRDTPVLLCACPLVSQPQLGPFSVRLDHFETPGTPLILDLMDGSERSELHLTLRDPDGDYEALLCAALLIAARHHPDFTLHSEDTHHRVWRRGWLAAKPALAQHAGTSSVRMPWIMLLPPS